MYLQYRTDDHQPITFGDLCEALADRELPAAVHDGYYIMRKHDLRRFVAAASASSEQTPMLLELFMREPVRAAG